MQIRCLSLTLLFCCLVVTVNAQQPDRNSPLVKTVMAFQELLEQTDDEITAAAKNVLAEHSFDKLLEKVVEARRHTKQQEVGDVVINGPKSGQFVYEVGNQMITVDFKMTDNEPIRIDSCEIKIESNSTGAEQGQLTWENLEAALDQAAEDGFEGTVLVTRDGEVFLNKGYGFANQEKGIKNSKDTIFAIGSAPIDFTHAGILLLKDQGKLKLDAAITEFFPNVPADKQAITIAHLMTGRSGLPDFHDLPTDENPDHTWIDRDEAIKRILANELLFKPGEGNEHSHSAWVLLAAIIEVVGGESYPEFTKENLFVPAGMKDTGFFGESIDEDRLAVGYGHRKSSDPNSPAHWGKTSWLVMGSGGQVSTLGDMYLWEVAMRNGKILSPESTRQYLGQAGAVAQDGDMFGFEFMHSKNPDQLFMIISNSIGSREERQAFNRLGRQLYDLIKPSGSEAKFSLGIAMAVSSDEGVIIQQVVPGSAAEKDGLLVGDKLLSANGKAMGENPGQVLAEFLQAAEPIEFALIRDGKTQIVRVTPTAKK